MGRDEWEPARIADAYAAAEAKGNFKLFLYVIAKHSLDLSADEQFTGCLVAWLLHYRPRRQPSQHYLDLRQLVRSGSLQGQGPCFVFRRGKLQLWSIKRHRWVGIHQGSTYCPKHVNLPHACNLLRSRWIQGVRLDGWRVQLEWCLANDRGTVDYRFG